jgi:hypothetical protein
MNSNELFATLIAIQFAVLAWRIDREVKMMDDDRLSWLPVYDLLNIVSIIASIFTKVVFKNNSLADLFIRVGYVLIGSYPVNTLAHYGIGRKGGRQRKGRDGDYRYLPDREIVTLVLTLIFSLGAAFL